MVNNELQEIQDLKEMWEKKYPDVYIQLWGNDDCSHYYGRMTARTTTTDLTADSISALIALGEEFLRKVI